MTRKSAALESRTRFRQVHGPGKRTTEAAVQSSRISEGEIFDSSSVGIVRHICGQRAFLFAYGRRRGVKVDLEDVVQETQLRAWLRRDRFRGQSEGELRKWLSAIFTNVHFDLWRKRKVRAQKAALAADPQEFECPFEQQVDADRAVARIEKLSQGQLAVLCGFLDGQDYQQIADVLNVRVGTVKSRLARAREAICHE